MQNMKIFVSSPGDVGQERLLAERVIERLQGEFAAYVALEPIFWEDKPMEASQHFQSHIDHDLLVSDIVICILWQRLGTQLPSTYVRPDSSPYLSGTEWEFETAINLYNEKGKPTVLVYKKTKKTELHMYEGEERQMREHQLSRLNEFWLKWFGDHKEGFKSAYTSFENTDDFEEKLEIHLRKVIQKTIPEIGTEGQNEMVAPCWFSGSPYRGLESFDVEHSSVFFGRTKAISEIQDCLLHQVAAGCSFLLVLGRSGCGKSSLVRAGVIPTITHPGVIENIDKWYYVSYRPGDYNVDLFTGLRAAFAAKSAFPEILKKCENATIAGDMLSTLPQEFIKVLQDIIMEKATVEKDKLGLGRLPAARVLVYIDQFEEVFSNERYDLSTRHKFIKLLNLLSRCGFIWVIATMRSDLYGRCCEDSTLVKMKAGTGQYDLLPPSFAEIGSIIKKPTYAAGLRFEKDLTTGQTLDQVLHEVAARNPSALPLLEFTLAELYKRRSGNILTFAAYHSLGGMEGALAFYAENVFNTMPIEIQKELPGLLRLLISIDREEENVISNRILLGQIINEHHKIQLVNALVEARLLVADHTKTGDPMVGVAHESLLHCWPRVQQWLRQEQNFLRIRSWLNEEALIWQREGKRTEYLLAEGKPLDNGREALGDYSADLTSLIIEYVTASEQKARHRRLRRRMFMAAATLLFICTTIVFLRTSWGEKLVEFRHTLETIIMGRVEIAAAEKFNWIDDKITLLDIDNVTFNKWGKPDITPRDKLAELVEMLDHQGAKVIVFDIFFDEPDYQYPAKDDRLRQTLKNILSKPDGPKVIFPVKIYEDQSLGKNIFDDLIDEKTRFFRAVPWVLVASNFDNNMRFWTPYGLVNGEQGEKKVLWGTPLLTAVVANGSIDQLEEVEQQILANERKGGTQWRKEIYSLTVHNDGQDRKVAFTAADKNEQQRIKYYMIPKGIITSDDPGNLFMQSIKVSEVDHLTSISKNIFRNKIVIIGNSSRDKNDNYPTPVGTMPGMYIHANIMNSILKGL